jgi:hypothetical protein
VSYVVVVVRFTGEVRNEKEGCLSQWRALRMWDVWLLGDFKLFSVNRSLLPYMDNSGVTSSEALLSSPAALAARQQSRVSKHNIKKLSTN